MFPHAKVVGLEHSTELVKLAIKNTAKHHAALLEQKRVEFVVGDGRKGYGREGLYDVIHVGAAAIPLPEALIEEMNTPSVLVCPVGGTTLLLFNRGIWPVLDEDCQA